MPGLLRRALLLALALGTTAQAGTPPSPENFLPPRPQLALYDSEHAFVAALLAWQRERDALAERLQRGDWPVAPAAPEAEHDWHHITGPEDIDQALENAAGFEQPHYEEPRRFNRSTHVSFPLPPLAPEQLLELEMEPERKPERQAPPDQPR